MTEPAGPYAITRTGLHYWAKIRYDLVDLLFGRRWVVHDGAGVCGNFDRMRKPQAIKARDALNGAYFDGWRRKP